MHLLSAVFHESEVIFANNILFLVFSRRWNVYTAQSSSFNGWHCVNKTNFQKGRVSSSLGKLWGANVAILVKPTGGWFEDNNSIPAVWEERRGQERRSINSTATQQLDWIVLQRIMYAKILTHTYPKSTLILSLIPL